MEPVIRNIRENRQLFLLPISFPACLRQPISQPLNCRPEVQPSLHNKIADLLPHSIAVQHPERPLPQQAIQLVFLVRIRPISADGRSTFPWFPGRHDVFHLVDQVLHVLPLAGHGTQDRRPPSFILVCLHVDHVFQFRFDPIRARKIRFVHHVEVTNLQDSRLHGINICTLRVRL